MIYYGFWLLQLDNHFLMVMASTLTFLCVIVSSHVPCSSHTNSAQSDSSEICFLCTIAKMLHITMQTVDHSHMNSSDTNRSGASCSRSSRQMPICYFPWEPQSSFQGHFSTWAALLKPSSSKRKNQWLDQKAIKPWTEWIYLGMHTIAITIDLLRHGSISDILDRISSIV